MDKNYQILEYSNQNCPKRYHDAVIDLYRDYYHYRNYGIPPFPIPAIEAMFSTPDSKVYPSRRFLLVIEDEVISLGNFYRSTVDNLKIAEMVLFVKDNYRNQGYGKLFLKYLVEKLNPVSEIITITVCNPNPDIQLPAQNWLERVGFKLGKIVKYSGSNLTQFEINSVIKKTNQLKEKAESLGYSFYFIEDYKFKENPYVDYSKYLETLERIWNDMPREDSEFGDEVINEEMHQEIVKRAKTRNERIWTYVALHKNSGEPIGMTETFLPQLIPFLALQDDTGVINPHRGNKLGLTLKYLMLAKLLTDETTKELKWWTTNNAGSNIHMLNINKELKYEYLCTRYNYQIRKSDLKVALRL